MVDARRISALMARACLTALSRGTSALIFPYIPWRLLNNVTTSGFTLTPHHTRSLRNSSKSLSEVLGSANERHLERVLRDVVLVVGHGEDLALCEITKLVRSGFDARFTYHRCSQHQRLAGSEPRPAEDLGKHSKFCAQ